MNQSALLISSLSKNLNVISYVIYTLLIVSFIVTSKKASKGNLNDGAFSLEAMTNLKGVMALCVLCHHISQVSIYQNLNVRSAGLEKLNVIPFFESLGFVFVGIFFFTSGFGLYKSFSTKKDYLNGFIKRRILPIVISYYVMVAIYAIYYLITKPNFSVSEWICKLTGLTLINSQSWYVYVIIIMYFAFYFIYKNEKARKYGVLILTIIVLLQGAIFVINGHFPWWIGKPDWWKVRGALFNCPWWQRPTALLFEGEWWVNATICFPLGILFAIKEQSFVQWCKKNYWVKFVLIAILVVVSVQCGNIATRKFGYWTEFSGELGTKKKAITYLIQNIEAIIACVFVVMLMQKFYVQNKFYTLLGKLSLEFYLMQKLVLFSKNYMIKSCESLENISYWPVVAWLTIVFTLVFLSAVVVHSINYFLTKKLKADNLS